MQAEDDICRIRDWQDAHPDHVPEPQSWQRSLPEELQQQFQSILRLAEAHDLALPRVVPDLAAYPRVVPDVAAPPRVVPDVAAPPSASEDSDVEIVCVRPGKRARVGEGILKVEPLMKSLLPVGSQVKLERAVKSEPSSESSGHRSPRQLQLCGGAKSIGSTRTRSHVMSAKQKLQVGLGGATVVTGMLASIA